MTDVFLTDERAVHRALAEEGDQVTLIVSRASARLLARVLMDRVDAVVKGAPDVPEEVTPNEAARMLGVSRPQIRKMMDQGELPFRMVGSHHRISLEAIESFRLADDARRDVAMQALADLQNELGLTE